MEKEIIELYNSDVPIKLIKERYKLSYGKIYRILDSNGISKNKRGRAKRNTKVEYNDLSEMYLRGISITEISEKMKICKATIYKALKIKGVEYFHEIDGKKFKTFRKYHLNENYFNEINSEDKAYFLGLLYSDGCNNGGGFYITLQDRDIEILEKFKERLEFSGDLKTIISKNGKWKNYKSLNISSKKMADVLENIGCNKNKTIRGKFPTIPVELMNHFIRGIFDGDGSIWNSRGQLGFSIVGNSNIIMEIAKVLNENCELSVKVRRPKRYKSDISVYSFQGNLQCARVFEYLYKNSSYYLERKFLKFKKDGNKD